MAFSLPDLPYAHDALASKGMSAETLEFHHDLHHNAYVTNGNKAIEGTEVVIPANAGSEGKLFGSIGTIDIAEALHKAGIEVERAEVRLPEGPLRVVGDHAIELHLHSDVTVPLTVRVVAEE